MKFAKLGFQTKEGISLGHYEDGWSREWGEGGSYHVELLFNEKKVAEAFEEGNGGMLDLNFTVADHKDVDKAVADFLLRTDETFRPGGKFSKYFNPEKVSADDYAMFIAKLITEYEIRKDAKKYLKKGYKTVCSIQGEVSARTVASYNEDKNAILAHIQEKGYNKNNETITFYSENDLTSDL